MSEEKSIKRQRLMHWLALFAVCLGVFMSLLDVTVVNVALPTIQTDFNESFNNLQWIINAYTMMYAVSLLLFAKLGDLFGRKRLFQIGMLIFTLGSLASALAQSGLALNLARGFQGIGGAGMMSLSMAIVASTFQGRERGVALGIWSSVIGLATALGPLAGGILVQFFSWRAIFLVNLPIGLIALVMGFFFIENTAGQHRGRIDWLGIIISTGAVFSLIMGLLQKEQHPNWTWLNIHVAGLLALGIVLLIAFVLIELRLSDPMMDMHIFKSWTFVGAALASFALGAGLYAFYTYLTVLMQNYIGYSAMQTGVRQLAISLFSLFLGPIIGILTNRWGNRWLIFGGLTFIGCGLLIIQYALSPTMTYIDFVAGFVLMGIGNATVNPPLSSAAVSAVDPKHLGMASGIINVFRQFGISFGVVMLGIQLTSGYQTKINHLIGAVQLPAAAIDGIKHGLLAAGPFSGKEVLHSPQAAQLRNTPFMDQLSTIVTRAFDYGFSHVLTMSIALVFIGALAAAIMIRDKRTPLN